MRRLVMADTHFRDDCPEMRKDDYQRAQWRKLDFMLKAAKELKCDEIRHVGDFFHKSEDRVKSTFIAEIIKRLLVNDIPIKYYPGNHDCPNHRVDRLRDGRMAAILAAVENMEVCKDGECDGVEMFHTFVWHPDDRPSDKIPGVSAEDLLKRTKADLVLVGDNHQSFIYSLRGRTLINPGSMMRMTIDQRKFKPKIYVWDDGNLQSIDLPIEKDVFLVQGTTIRMEVDSRMEKYVSKMESAERIQLDFKENMKTYLEENPEDSEVEDIIWNAMGE
jgi:predicted phosphodiesterase